MITLNARHKNGFFLFCAAKRWSLKEMVFKMHVCTIGNGNIFNYNSFWLHIAYLYSLFSICCFVSLLPWAQNDCKSTHTCQGSFVYVLFHFIFICCNANKYKVNKCHSNERESIRSGNFYDVYRKQKKAFFFRFTSTKNKRCKINDIFMIHVLIYTMFRPVFLLF